MPVELPHFSLPFRLGTSGRFAVDEQDSPSEIVACVAICLATPIGSRAEVPDFGSPSFQFELPDPGDVIAAVEEWEDRASLDLEVVRGMDGTETAVQITTLVRPAIGEED